MPGKRSYDQYRPPKYGEDSLKRLKIAHPLKGCEGEGRIFYNTVKLVHEPVYEHAHRCEMKELKKIRDYDDLKASVKRYAAEKATAILSGDEKLKSLKHWLDNLGLKRHFLQVLFHEQMILACLSKIYEDEWETQYEQIMKRFDIRKMKRELIFSCPRRFGKTYSVALFAAAYLLSIPRCQVAIFSTGKRTAKKLMVLILHFLTFFPGIEDPGRIKVKNQEDLVLNFGSGDDRCLSCYPSSVKVCEVTHGYARYVCMYRSDADNKILRHLFSQKPDFREKEVMKNFDASDQKEAELAELTSSYCKNARGIYSTLLSRSTMDYERYRKGLKAQEATTIDDPIATHRTINQLLSEGEFVDAVTSACERDAGTVGDFRRLQQKIMSATESASTQTTKEEEEEEGDCLGANFLDREDPLLSQWISNDEKKRVVGQFVKTLNEDTELAYYESVACYAQSVSAGSSSFDDADEGGGDNRARRWSKEEKRSRTVVTGLSMLDYLSRIVFKGTSLEETTLVRGISTNEGDARVGDAGSLKRIEERLFVAFVSSMNPDEGVAMGSCEHYARLTFLFRIWDVLGLQKPPHADDVTKSHMQCVRLFLYAQKLWMEAVSSDAGFVQPYVNDLGAQEVKCFDAICLTFCNPWALSYVMEPVFCGLYRTAAITFYYSHPRGGGDGDVGGILVKGSRYANMVIADETRTYYYAVVCGGVHHCLLWCDLTAGIEDRGEESTTAFASNDSLRIIRSLPPKTDKRPREKTAGKGKPTRHYYFTSESQKIRATEAGSEKEEQEPAADDTSDATFCDCDGCKGKVKMVFRVVPVASAFSSIPIKSITSNRSLRKPIVSRMKENSLVEQRCCDNCSADPERDDDERYDFYYDYAPLFVTALWSAGGRVYRSPGNLAHVIVIPASPQDVLLNARRVDGIREYEEEEKERTRIRNDEDEEGFPVIPASPNRFLKPVETLVRSLDKRLGRESRGKFLACLYDLDAVLYELDFSLYDFSSSRHHRHDVPSPPNERQQIHPALTVFPMGEELLRKSAVFSAFSIDPSAHGPIECLSYDDDAGIGKVNMDTKNYHSFPLTLSAGGDWKESKIYFCWFTKKKKKKKDKEKPLQRDDGKKKDKLTDDDDDDEHARATSRYQRFLFSQLKNELSLSRKTINV